MSKFEVEKPAKIYFISLEKDDSTEIIAQKTKILIEKSGMASVIKEKTMVAIKQHFGEQGNEGHIKPEVTKEAIEMVKEKGAFPLVVETNTLYHGSRSNTYNHLMVANEHGFSLDKLGAPIVILDGINGQNQKAVKIPGEHFKEVNMVTDIPFFGSIIALSHVKGHMLTGMGGAIKNLGMGFASRAGKLAQHADFKPDINEQKCTRCGLCAKYCAVEAITQSGDNAAKVDHGKCVGCGECYIACRFGAISFSWASGGKVQEKMAEHALGAIINHNKKVGFINVVYHISKECDCWGANNPAIYGNVGILAGFDPVAIDKASIDMAKQKFGKDIFKELWPNIDATIQLNHGEKIGLGTQEYQLTMINE